MDAGTLAQFEEELRKVLPNFKVQFKNESRLQWLIGVLIYPFNPGYYTQYTTTFGSTVYFASKEFYQSNPGSSFQVTAHEFVHAWDAQRDKLFSLKYALPQALGIVPLLVFAVLAGAQAWLLAIPVVGYVVSALLSRKSRAAFVAVLAVSLLTTLALGWFLTKWKILTLLGLAVVAPWPSPWRSALELRGYGMTLAVSQWVMGYVPSEMQSNIVEQFTGPAYFFMSHDKASVERTLEATRQQAQVGALQRISPYKEVYDFLYARRFVYRSNVA